MIFCKNCGKLIENRNVTYCCEECRQKYISKPNISCDMCGLEFHKKQSHIKKSKNHYCSSYCMYKHREQLYLGRKNPNCKYLFDDNFFKKVDSEEKAYLLGWIASDGSVTPSGFCINISSKDYYCLEKLKNIICDEIPIVFDNIRNMISFTVNSKTISSDICKLLNINPCKKSYIVEFPKIDDELSWAFLRGYFDGDGHVNNPLKNKNVKHPYPKCDIASNSIKMLNSIKDFCKVPCNISKNNDRIAWYGNNALEFLSKIYDNSSIFLTRKKDLYLDWCIWVPCLSGKFAHGKTDFFYWNKTNKNAVAPFKKSVTDSGYDLTLIDVYKKTDFVTYYDTGIKVSPPYGWYFMLVPRSSLSKTGYILSNSVGVIDRTYTGSILVPLCKIDKNAEDIELPFRCVQIIPMPIVHFQGAFKDTFEETIIGIGGFGSTDKS